MFHDGYMMTREAVEQFKKAYLKVHGVEIDDAKAIELGQSLLNMFKVIYRPLTTEKAVKENK